MIAGLDLYRRVGEVFKRVYKERPKGPIVDWGIINILLSREESKDFPGRYDPDLNPLPTVLFEAYQSGKYKKFVFKKSSQSGVTLAVLILVCWYVTYVCANFLYVIDSEKEMRRLSQIRLKPMLLACKAAAGRIPENKDDLASLTLNMRGCVGYLCTANSLGELSNKSVGLAVYDEVDAYKKIKDGDEKATDLGKERGKAQSQFVEILLSKPRDWDDSTNQEYLNGTRHKCFVPCPHADCGEFQVLEWEQLKFSHCKDAKGLWETSRLESEIYFECRKCRGKIEEHHKVDMIKAREWRQTNFGKGDEDEDEEHPPQSGVFSCEITDMYSTRRGSSWADLAEEWINAQGDPSKRRNFLRGRLARPTKSKKVQVKTSDLFKMVLPYERGHCPVEPHFVVMGVDVQESPPVKKWVKAAFRVDTGACYVVDWGEYLAFDDLVEQADIPVIVDKWDRFTPVSERVNPVVRVGLVDERHDRDNVRNFIVSTHLGTAPDGNPVYRFYSCRGWGGMHTRRMKSIVTPLIGEKANASHEGWPLWVYDLSDDDFKNRLYNDRINRFREVLAAREAGEPPPENYSPLHFPGTLDQQLASELSQEKFQKDPKTGEWGWIRPKAPNDLGDALKYCYSGEYLLKNVVQMERAQAIADRLAAAKARALSATAA